ncbi:MAG: hypothetical protein PVH68_04740 [Armatimonadota bacterium]
MRVSEIVDWFAIILLTAFFAVAGAVALVVVCGAVATVFQRSLFLGCVLLAFGAAYVLLVITVERNPEPPEEGHDG